MKAAFQGLPLKLELLATRRQLWRVIHPFRFQMMTEHGGLGIQVKAGWVTDLTSIPWWLPLRKEGPWTPASVVHDVGYARGRIFHKPGNLLTERRATRLEVDELYLRAMRELDVPEWKAKLIYRGVRAGGWVAWRRHRRKDKDHFAGKARAAGDHAVVQL